MYRYHIRVVPIVVSMLWLIGWLPVSVTASGMMRQAVTAASATGPLDIVGPPGSSAFGASVTVLPNGNIVIADPLYDAPGAADVGAVYLHDGATGAQISVLTGSTTGDRVGLGGVTVLANGNYVVSSRVWHSSAGAITWGSATAGVSGVVSVTNSLVGSSAEAYIGDGGVVALPSGNYVVRSHTGSGAVTWGSGTSGVSGVVSTENSLAGGRGGELLVLANGNYVVLSPFWSNGPAANAGAVTWGSGTSGVTGLISAANSLVGSSPDDMGLYITLDVRGLSNGNYVVITPGWDNGSAADAGAVTWGSGASGVTGVVSAATSLVGTSRGDRIGSDGIVELASGNYIVRSPDWTNGPAADAGAVTWGSEANGVKGPVSSANSLVGSSTGDRVGGDGVWKLANSNYVVLSTSWDNGALADVGAATWGSGTSGVTGPVSAANSLVGSWAFDRVGQGRFYGAGVTALETGNYVVSSTAWHADMGAVTWGSGTSGVTGEVSATNSLVGATFGDSAGSGGVAVLTNGNYIVVSPSWDNGATANVGAATWGSGTNGVTGVISAANSLVGSTLGDGGAGTWDAVTWAIPLSNGNYVVSNPHWDDGAVTDAGAVTWGSGTSGVAGVIGAANSLVGSSASDQVGLRYGQGIIQPLPNGNYVVGSSLWDSGAVVDAGAVTWGSGTNGVTGAISAANSLVGSTSNDGVGAYVLVLPSGNYVAFSPGWDKGALTNAGAVTWGSGTGGITGAISAANSLVGSSAFDEVGGVAVLTNGNYVVTSKRWDNGVTVDAGAVTWGSGTGGIVGSVSATNSIVGVSAGDYVGDVTALPNGDFVVVSPEWDSGAVVGAGAITWGNGDGTTVGPIGPANTVRGTTASGGMTMTFTYDATHNHLVVGRPADNTVTIMGLNVAINQRPVAHAGLDQTVRSLARVTLDGSASVDSDGNLPVSFGWRQIGGAAVALDRAAPSRPAFTAPAVVTETTTLTFTLIVTDSLGLASESAQVVVWVEPYRVALPHVGR